MKFLKAIAKVDDILFTIATVFLAGGCGLAVINALFRKAFNMALPWAEELSTYLVVMMLFLAFAHLERLDRHLCIDILMTSLRNKEKARRFFRVLRSVWTIIVMAILLWYGVFLAHNMVLSQVSTYVLRWPRAPFFMILLVGYAMTVLVYVNIIVKRGGEFDDSNS